MEIARLEGYCLGRDLIADMMLDCFRTLGISQQLHEQTGQRNPCLLPQSTYHS